MFTGAQMMNDLREDLLACAAFTCDEDSQIGGGHLTRYINSPVEQRGMTYDPKPLFDGLYLHCLRTIAPVLPGLFVDCKINQNTVI